MLDERDGEFPIRCRQVEASNISFLSESRDVKIQVRTMSCSSVRPAAFILAGDQV